MSEPFMKYNFSNDYLDHDEERRNVMMRKLDVVSPNEKELKRLMSVFSGQPITNEQTVQRILFYPAKGQMFIDTLQGINDQSQHVFSRAYWEA